VDGRTYGRIHRRTFETGFIRSTMSKSRPRKTRMRLLNYNRPGINKQQTSCNVTVRPTVQSLALKFSKQKCHQENSHSSKAIHAKTLQNAVTELKAEDEEE